MHKTDITMVSMIESAARSAFERLFAEHEENFYYCSLITTGDGLCPIVSAWSREALERAAQMELNPDEAKHYLKWSYCDSPYFAFGEEFFSGVAELFAQRSCSLTDAQAIDEEVSLRISSMEEAMRRLDGSGLFGCGEKRLAMVINAEFMPPDYTNTQRALRLNPPEALVRWLEEAAEPIEE